MVGYLYNVNRSVVGYLETKDDVRQWAAKGLAEELAQAGFIVNADAPLLSALRMEIAIDKVLCGTDHAHYAASVGLGVRVLQADQVLLQESFETRYVGDVNVVGSPEGYGETLGVALRATSRKAVFALRDQLGLPTTVRGECPSK